MQYPKTVERNRPAEETLWSCVVIFVEEKNIYTINLQSEEVGKGFFVIGSQNYAEGRTAETDMNYSDSC